MAVLAECPACHNKQSTSNEHCRNCGEWLIKRQKGNKLVRNPKIRYWIQFRAGKVQRKEYVGESIDEAKDADGKRKGQKREGRIFDMLPQATMTFKELAEWYLKLGTVKKLASYVRVQGVLANFNKVFGDRVVGTIRTMELEGYQTKREDEGVAPATIDMEISITKTMIIKAFDNDKVDGKVVKAFRNVKRKLKRAENARRRVVSVEEYVKLIGAATRHLRDILTVAYNTGMRSGELRQLKWSHIDRKNKVIRLPKEITKERKAKVIPINHHVDAVLCALPFPLHNDGFVFTYRGKGIQDTGGLKRSFRTACKNAEIPRGRDTENGITFHDIRRTVKTHMLNAGVDKVYRDVILGHSLQRMDVHYIVPSEDDLKRELAKYTMWLDEQIKRTTDCSSVGRSG